MKRAVAGIAERNLVRAVFRYAAIKVKVRSVETARR